MYVKYACSSKLCIYSAGINYFSFEKLVNNSTQKNKT